MTMAWVTVARGGLAPAPTMFDITPDEIRGRIAPPVDVRAMYDYWLAKRGDRPMPAHADIDPARSRDSYR